MWQYISWYNLQPCSNPLHKYHRVPVIVDAPLDVDYVYRSAKYLDRTYEAVDLKFSLNIEPMMPLEHFVQELEKLNATEGNSN